jgi:hypothetical protein
MNDDQHELDEVIVALSIETGVDLTFDQDLEKRLDGAVQIVQASLQDLEELQGYVRTYEETVDGHTLVNITPLNMDKYL